MHIPKTPKPIENKIYHPIWTKIWRLLDRLYDAAAIIAALFMTLILFIITAQMLARWTGTTFEGATEFAGYAMAATSFFALAHTLRYGGHIRVSIFLNLNAFTQYWLNAIALLIAAITATYFARFAIKTNILSHLLNDRTQGQDKVPQWLAESLLGGFKMLATPPWEWSQIGTKIPPTQILETQASETWVYTPLWLPQLPMSIGTTLLAIALWDHLIRLLISGQNPIKSETIDQKHNPPT